MTKIDQRSISKRTTTAHTATGDMPFAVGQLRVARDLQDAEAALDEALIRQARLLATMVDVRRETGLAPFTGQDALMRLVKSQQAMVDAGGELARVHGRLSAIAVETAGGNDGCPPKAVLADDVAAMEAFGLIPATAAQAA
jgi:hypothetical protein